MSITVKELKSEICGLTEDNGTKTLVALSIHKIDTTGYYNDPIIVTECFSQSAEVQINGMGNFTSVDLGFANDKHQDLKDFYRILEEYLAVPDKYADNEDTVCFLSLYPNALEGKAYINAVYPVFWGFQKPQGSEEFSILRIVFLSGDVLFLESDMDSAEFDSMVSKAVVEKPVIKDYTLD